MNIPKFDIQLAMASTRVVNRENKSMDFETTALMLGTLNDFGGLGAMNVAALLDSPGQAAARNRAPIQAEGENGE